MDEFLRIVSNGQRRQTLLELHGRSVQADGGVTIADPTENCTEESEIQLYHNHLPRLAEGDYIVWNQDTGEVRKRPKFDEIRPLLELLDSHADELPENRI
ncbi:DUF7344 domain-containing protein [Natrinema salsiterrestre]|uniref:ArsR family transcriptional regulator n=1 Tax=Natrinema salsiterrestre TaxID=2950540 RepID=A0A9Q4Q4V7_9EURY|nr:ArsR family transcriptional regulator [Natrinema salsiterrestre]MDF9747902.1 ArsR family transcriptional regulator [Natrinema salsiterrestre]